MSAQIRCELRGVVLCEFACNFGFSAVHRVCVLHWEVRNEVYIDHTSSFINFIKKLGGILSPHGFFPELIVLFRRFNIFLHCIYFLGIMQLLFCIVLNAYLFSFSRTFRFFLPIFEFFN